MYFRIFLLSLFLLLVNFTHSYAQSELGIDKINGLQIERIEGKEIILGFSVSIKNPSSKNVGIKIKKGKIYRNGEYMGTVALLKKIKIKGGVKENIEVKLKVVLDKELNLMEEGLRALSGRATELRATGTFKATWLIFWKRYPFDYKEKVSLRGLVR